MRPSEPRVLSLSLFQGSYGSHFFYSEIRIFSLTQPSEVRILVYLERCLISWFHYVQM